MNMSQELKEKMLPKLQARYERRNRDGKSRMLDELLRGNYLFLEQGKPLCLACADLDHLVFLPAGNTALTRRARKHSPLSAVVVRFSRSRKRYERQGILVTEVALDQAEEECAADRADRWGH